MRCFCPSPPQLRTRTACSCSIRPVDCTGGSANFLCFLVKARYIPPTCRLESRIADAPISSLRDCRRYRVPFLDAKLVRNCGTFAAPFLPRLSTFSPSTPPSQAAAAQRERRFFFFRVGPSTWERPPPFLPTQVVPSPRRPATAPSHPPCHPSHLFQTCIPPTGVRCHPDAPPSLLCRAGNCSLSQVPAPHVLIPAPSPGADTCPVARRFSSLPWLPMATIRGGNGDWLCGEASCGKEFKTKQILRRHQENVHDGRRDWICDEPRCKKAFGRRGGMMTHRRTVHEGRREWKCDAHCGRTFSSRQNLMRHKSRPICQSVASSQHVSLPPRKRKREDDTAATLSTTPCNGSGNGRDVASPLSALHLRQRRPQTSSTPIIQKTVHKRNWGGSDYFSRNPFPSGVGEEVGVHIEARLSASSLGGDTHAFSPVLSPLSSSVPPLASLPAPWPTPLRALSSTAEVTPPATRDSCLSFIAQDSMIQGRRPKLHAGAPAAHFSVGITATGMNEQETLALKLSKASQVPRTFLCAVSQTPPIDAPQSTAYHLRGNAPVNSHFSAPTGGRISDRRDRSGEKTILGEREWNAELLMAPGKLREVERKPVDAVGPGDEMMRADGGRCGGGPYLQPHGGYLGSRVHSQNILEQHGGFEGTSERDMISFERRNASQGYCYRAVNYYGSVPNDPGRGSGAGGTVQRKDQHEQSYRCVEERQSGRSMGIRTNNFECRRQASTKEHKFCPGTRVCLAGLLSVSMNGRSGTVVPAHPPIANRVAVLLDHDGKEFKIKFANLTMISDGFLD